MPTPTGTPYYASPTDLQTVYGTPAIVQSSDLEGLGVVNLARCNYFLLQSDAMINSVYLGQGKDSIQEGGNLSLGPIGIAKANRWACTLAYSYLYANAFGPQDEKYVNKIKPQVDQVMREMVQASAQRLMGTDNAQAWPVSDGGPVAVTANERGTQSAPAMDGRGGNGF